LLKDGFVVNTILKEADLFCPNSVRINFTIYRITIVLNGLGMLFYPCTQMAISMKLLKIV
ncbi:hypothetical protein, partial [Lactiplantibacillus plantarum]|uniref:hypothetical protein n=1 Tax=Lactiplantibacillus plantarum TaxID=1590 RepID=UPI002739472D